MKSIILSSRSREKKLHIEAPGCIINIQIGLTDCYGHEVTSIRISADGDCYSGESPWWIDGIKGQDGTSLRVVREDAP